MVLDERKSGIRVGSKVAIADGIPAVISSISIEEGCRIQYQCVWWDGRVRRSEWLNEFEVRRTDKTQGMDIGFNRASSR